MKVSEKIFISPPACRSSEGPLAGGIFVPTLPHCPAFPSPLAEAPQKEAAQPALEGPPYGKLPSGTQPTNWPAHHASLHTSRFKRQKRGVKVKHIDHEGYRFTYFSRGEPGAQPSILMLHGFSLNKDIWLNMIKLFPQDLHVVCLDMPGHGDTTRLLGESYTVAAQAKRVHQFVQCLELNKKPFHLVGMSTGGMIAGVYAAHYPSEVCCLSLLCPAGECRHAVVPRRFFRTQRWAQGCGQAGAERMALALPCATMPCCCFGPNSGFLILKGFLDISSAKSRFILHENMRRIRAPTQIIWGREDKVFDSTGAEMLATAIHNSQVHMLEKCGHFIALERPMKTAKLLLEFYSSVCERMGDKQPAQSSPRSQAAAE
uniref:acylglycerol lipase n=1 Tax=Varanus komodoensis TaxID=61221 RepID=A0A8D2Q693_VARKO